MKTIHKYHLERSTDVQDVKLPESGRPLRVDFILQDRTIQMWAEVDADSVIGDSDDVRRFKIFPTGAGIPDNAEYVGTAVDVIKPEAFHVYELID
jgi:hypothetical protein